MDVTVVDFCLPMLGRFWQVRALAKSKGKLGANKSCAEARESVSIAQKLLVGECCRPNRTDTPGVLRGHVSMPAEVLQSTGGATCGNSITAALA